MRHTKPVFIGSIKMDRYPLNIKTLNLVKYIEKGGNIPAIHVQKEENGGFKICDGRHRVTAYKLLGKQYIMAKFSYLQ